MTTEDPGYTDEIRQAAAHVADLLALDFVHSGGDLLPELTALDQAEQHVRRMRDRTLVEVRRRGVSWNTIKASTGVAATTWRTRHQRFTEEASPS